MPHEPESTASRRRGPGAAAGLLPGGQRGRGTKGPGRRCARTGGDHRHRHQRQRPRRDRAGRASAQLDSQVSDRLDGFSYSLGAGLSRRNEACPASIAQQRSDASGTPDLVRLTRRRADGLAQAIGPTPKISPNRSDQDRISLEAVLGHNRFDDHGDDLRITTLAQLRLNWARTLDGGVLLEARLGSNHLRRAADARLLGPDDAGLLAMDERVTSSTTESGWLATGTQRLPYREDHALALGRACPAAPDGRHPRQCHGPAPHDGSVDNHVDAGGRLTQTTDAPSPATIRLGVELKL